MAFGNFVQGEYPADMRLESAFIRKLSRGAQHLAVTLGADPVHSRRSHELENERGVQAEQLLRDLVAGRADAGDEPAIRRHAIQRTLESLAPDCVENNRASTSACLSPGALHKIRVAVIDEDVRADLPAKIQRLVAAGGRENPATVAFGDLDCHV